MKLKIEQQHRQDVSILLCHLVTVTIYAKVFYKLMLWKALNKNAKNKNNQTIKQNILLKLNQKNHQNFLKTEVKTLEVKIEVHLQKTNKN